MYFSVNLYDYIIMTNYFSLQVPCHISVTVASLLFMEGKGKKKTAIQYEVYPILDDRFKAGLHILKVQKKK